MSEWSIVRHSKCRVPKGTQGSNPCLSAKQKKHPLRVLFCLVITDVGIRSRVKKTVRWTVFSGGEAQAAPACAVRRTSRQRIVRRIPVFPIRFQGFERVRRRKAEKHHGVVFLAPRRERRRSRRSESLSLHLRIAPFTGAFCLAFLDEGIQSRVKKTVRWTVFSGRVAQVAAACAVRRTSMQRIVRRYVRPERPSPAGEG